MIFSLSFPFQKGGQGSEWVLAGEQYELSGPHNGQFTLALRLLALVQCGAVRCGAGWTCPLVSALLLLVHCCCTAALLLHKLEAGCAHTHMHHVASTGHPSQAPKQRLLGYSVPITPYSVLRPPRPLSRSLFLSSSHNYLPTYIRAHTHTHLLSF